jgi:pimeloyl-ACP methyl ester carboxylesterase
MSFLELDGVDLYYELHGEGPAVVFVHGVSGTHLVWWQQIAEIRHHFSCLIFDQRGFGRSRPTRPYNVGDGHLLYHDLCSLIDHVGWSQEKLSFVGASLGTGPSLHYAMEHRDQIDKLVMVCGVGGVQTPLTIAGSEQRTARMKARQKEIQSSQPSTVSVGTRRVPPVRSPASASGSRWPITPTARGGGDASRHAGPRLPLCRTHGEHWSPSYRRLETMPASAPCDARRGGHR